MTNLSEAVTPPPLDGGNTTALPTERKAHNRTLLWGTVVVLIAGGTLGAVLASKSAPPSTRAKDSLNRALYLTVAEKSYSFTMKETISPPGSPATLSVHAKGICALNSSLCNFTMNLEGFSITAISKGGTIYEKVPSNDPVSIPTPWVSAPLGAAATKGSTSMTSMAGPLSELSMLASEGAQVSSAGGSTIYGQHVSVYDVTFSKEVSQRVLRSSLKKYPSWMQREASGVTLGATSETVDVGSSGRLVAMSATSSVQSSGEQLNVTIAEHITGYGLPVTVTIPPSSEVTPIAKLSTPSS